MRQKPMDITYVAIYDMLQDEGFDAFRKPPKFIMTFYGLQPSDFTWIAIADTQVQAEEAERNGEDTHGGMKIIRALKRRGLDPLRYRSTIWAIEEADQSYARKVPREYIKRGITV